MHQEQDVPDPHRTVAIVLRELIGVELGERPRQALLDLRRDGLTLALLARPERIRPVDRKQLGHLVGTLDHAGQRVRHQPTMRLVPRHLAQHQQRRMPQLHHLAGLDGERGRARGLDRRDQRLDAVGDGNAVLVELVLPEEAVHQRALERHFGREALAARALMGEGANDLVQTDHDGLLFGLIVMEKTAPGNRRVCTAREGNRTLCPTELRMYHPGGIEPPALRSRSNRTLHHRL